MPPVDWPTVMKFWEFALRISHDLDGSITGGPRTYGRNVEKGGHPNSRHKWDTGWGCAADYVFATHMQREEARTRAVAAGYFPVVKADYGPFRLHLQAWKYAAPLVPIGGSDEPEVGRPT